MRCLIAGLCIVILAAPAAADDVVSPNGDRLAGLVSLGPEALAGATGGFRIGELEIGIGAVIRTAISDGGAAPAAGGLERVDAYALEPGTPAGSFRSIGLPGTSVTGRGLAAIIENTQNDRAISRQVTLDVEIAGLASAVRAAAVGRAVAAAAGPARRFR